VVCFCWQINCARGSICDPDAVVRACESGQLKGYSGDVWISPHALMHTDILSLSLTCSCLRTVHCSAKLTLFLCLCLRTQGSR
jgi:lactate dehydrogenase-like 2-hydroxyacid dehydrogenase